MGIVEKFIKEGQLTREEYPELLHLYQDPDSVRLLREEAVRIQKKYFGNKIYTRGLIEFTNYCRNDCYYCGIRRSNKNVSRYRLTKEEILNRIKEGGVVGMGGAGFPTHVKLAPKDPSKIEYILVNGAECEPYITSDYRRMIEEPEKVVKGLQVILTLFDSAKGYICIEDNKPDCIAKMKELVKDIDRIEVKEMMTKYPQGGERTLIYAATGREINSTMLPADVGCVVDNVETVISVYKAVILGRPVNSRVVTVTGDGIKEPKNLLVLAGTDMSELVDAAGGLKAKIAKAISGGPMMGFALYDLHVPCTKTTSAFLFLEHDAVSEAQEIQTACINCGRCVSVCPGHVLPARLAKLAERGDMAGFEALDGMECCECGCCSYICPAKRPLTQSIKSMRKMVLASRRKK